jgi:hypothetical protein
VEVLRGRITWQSYVEVGSSESFPERITASEAVLTSSQNRDREIAANETTLGERNDISRERNDISRERNDVSRERNDVSRERN